MDMWKCKHCEKTFDLPTRSARANHGRWCSDRPGSKDTTNQIKAQRKIVEAKLGLIRAFEVKCNTCGDTIITEEREKKFPIKQENYCNRSCAARVGAVARAKKMKERPDSELNYQTICFKYHEKKCIICGETRIVAAHHYDHDHSNNDWKNLIPMCPTHHQYVHSKYCHLVEKEMRRYVDNLPARSTLVSALC